MFRFYNCYKAEYSDIDGDHTDCYFTPDEDDSDTFAQKIEFYHENNSNSTGSTGNVQVWSHEEVTNPVAKWLRWISR